MGFYHFWAPAAGYLVILIQGPGLERLLNLASANGIYLWDIRRHPPDLMVAKIGPRGYRALRPYPRRARCRASIRRKSGLPFLLLRLGRRPGFILGFLGFISAIAILTGFIWRIELVGAGSIPASRLRRDLRVLGLYPGVWRGKMDKDAIRRKLAQLTPEAAWIGLEFRGVVAVVRVVQRAVPPPAEKAGDLVAAQDGLIESMVVYRGTAVVAEGDAVRAGQLLVSGREVRIGSGGGLVSLAVPAEAKVRARIWETAQAEVPLVHWREEPSGRRMTVLRLRLGRWLLDLGRHGPPWAWYAMTRSRRTLLQGRNRLPLVEIVIDRYDEIVLHQARRTEAEAIADGAEEVRALLRARAPDDPPAPVQLTERREGSWISISGSIEVRREIAVRDRRVIGDG